MMKKIIMSRDTKDLYGEESLELHFNKKTYTDFGSHIAKILLSLRDSYYSFEELLDKDEDLFVKIVLHNERYLALPKDCMFLKTDTVSVAIKHVDGFLSTTYSAGLLGDKTYKSFDGSLRLAEECMSQYSTLSLPMMCDLDCIDVRYCMGLMRAELNKRLKKALIERPNSKMTVVQSSIKDYAFQDLNRYLSKIMKTNVVTGFECRGSRYGSFVMRVGDSFYRIDDLEGNVKSLVRFFFSSGDYKCLSSKSVGSVVITSNESIINALPNLFQRHQIIICNSIN